MHTVLAKSILSSKNGMNIYRGCTHGCIYCDSRSTCYQINHLFEDIEIKINAPELLEEALKRKRKKCMISTGSMTDPYIHLEETLMLTRRCLEIVLKYGFGINLLTKSDRVLRDLDLIKQINEKTKCVVQMTLTTYDEKLCKVLEPNVSTTLDRFRALKVFRDNNIPTVVWLGPILPFINNTEENLRGILNYCIEAKVHGIVCFGMGLTLRDGNRQYYYKKLDQYFPGLKERYINTYGERYEIGCPNHKDLMNIFVNECKKHNILYKIEDVFNYLNSFEKYEQISLFDEY